MFYILLRASEDTIVSRWDLVVRQNQFSTKRYDLYFIFYSDFSITFIFNYDNFYFQ